MIDRRQVLLTVLLAPLFGRAAGAAATDSAVQLIEWLGQQAITALSQRGISLEEREAAFRILLRKAFNLDFIGRFVLGATWRRATPEQRVDYLELFGEFIVKTYAKRLGGYSGEAFVVLKSTVTGKKRDIIVKTRIDRPSGPSLKATWRVRKFGDQDKIIDVSVEGVSMAITQRQEFASVTRRSGLEGLLQILRARTEHLPATPSR